MPSSPPVADRAPTLVDRGRRYVATPAFQKLWRYGTVSVITTFVSLGCLYLFYRVLAVDRLDLGGWRLSSAGTANVYATAIATIPSYYLNRTWAWGKNGRSHFWKEVAPFWVIAAISLVLSTVVVGLASREAHRISSSHEVQTMLVELGNLATYGAMWVGKYFLFNRVLFHQADGSGRGAAGAPVPVTSAGFSAGATSGSGLGFNGSDAQASEPVAEAR